ncbi:hypothetical protein J6590_067755 [Homalodisca vitripennis]|nr:hypothetical protein J6590_067755 [Homalodisca vitripennis]
MLNTQIDSYVVKACAYEKKRTSSQKHCSVGRGQETPTPQPAWQSDRVSCGFARTSRQPEWNLATPPAHPPT